MKAIEPLRIVLYVIALLYAIHLLDVLLPFNFSQWGIVPRTSGGLRGIVFSPFLHGSWTHLMSNSVPLIVLLFLLITFYPKIAWKVIVASVVFSGAITWLIGRGGAVHIGASGVIYAFVAFLVGYGIMSRKMFPLLIAVVVALLYGGLVWGMLPGVAHYISWEGHLGGAIAGGGIAYTLRKSAYE